jgi:putative endonuclease
MNKSYYVYILSNKFNGTLYVGVTTNLVKRIWEHKEGLAEGFTKKYGIKYLVYFEAHIDVENAIKREKRLKDWKRQWKLDLINKNNPDWNDLYQEIIG